MRGYDAWKTRAPEHEPSDAEVAERDEEIAREQRWAEFIAWLRAQPNAADWWHTVGEVHDAILAQRSGDQAVMECYARYLNFAETEGWDGVLNVIARAMREQAQDAHALMDRR